MRFLSCSLLFATTAFAANFQEFFVAPPASSRSKIDSGATPAEELGTRLKPFRSLEAAQQAIRNRDDQERKTKPVFVRIRGGTYKGLRLSEQDSGTRAAPVTYTTWDEVQEGVAQAPVRLSGGVAIPSSAWQKTTVPSGAPNVYVADLFKLGLNSSSLGSLGHPYPSAKMELFYAGNAMTLARYPNINQAGTWIWMGYENLTAVSNVSLTLADRQAQAILRQAWGEDQQGLWLHGYWEYDWRESYVQVKTVSNWSSASKSFQVDTNPDTPPTDSFKAGCRFMAVNALALLDSPGEYFVSTKGKLYFCPPTPGPPEALAEVSVEGSVLSLNGASFTNFRGLHIEVSQGTAVAAQNLNSVAFSNCTVGLAGTTCISTTGSNVSVVDSLVSGCGASGITIGGGDVRSLQASGNVVRGNRVHGFARVRRTYNPGVHFSGVGHYIANNTIWDAPHTGMTGGGNQLLFEDNHMFHLCYETVDVGGFYVGRSWSQRGNIFRNNVITGVRATERLAQQSCSQNAFYLDDQMSGWLVEGNTFANAATGVLLGGGRRNVFRNNFFANNTLDIHFDNRGMNWQKASCQVNCDPSMGTSCFHAELVALNYTNPPYSTAYPVLPSIYKTHPCVPVYNIIADNQYCHLSGAGSFLSVDNATITSWLSSAYNNTQNCSW